MKEDYLVDTRSLQMEPYDSQIYLHMFDGNTEPVEPMQVNTIAHRQFGTHLKIPVHKGLDTDCPHAGLTVGDDDAGLYNVSRNNLR